MPDTVNSVVTIDDSVDRASAFKRGVTGLLSATLALSYIPVCFFDKAIDILERRHTPNYNPSSHQEYMQSVRRRIKNLGLVALDGNWRHYIYS